jgi:LysM repeat protein
MTPRDRSATHTRRAIGAVSTGLLALVAASLAGPLQAADLPVSAQQRSTAQKVAQGGVALSELAPNAPDSYTVKTHDTLWGISKIFLKSPWRWPELWGMNLDQIRNPHLIYPGQVLFLDKTGGRARLRLGEQLGANGTGKLSPRVRSSALDGNALASIPFNLIEPFLNEAVIFQTNELEQSPRIVATQAGRVLLSRGDLAYVRGDLTGNDYRVFREPKPLLDPTTREVLGFEAAYLGSAEYTRPGETRVDANGKTEIVPATFTVTNIKQEIGVGDRLSLVPTREFTNYSPHAPQGPVDGQIVSIYGDGLTAGQNQIVALNRGAQQGMERGHVLALLSKGEKVQDRTDPSRPTITLPDERHGLLFVFRVFDRMSYALILSVKEPVSAGDRFTQP